MNADESLFIINGVIPNKKGHILIDEWVGVQFKGENSKASVLPLSEVINKLELTKPIPNSRKFSVEDLQLHLNTAVEEAQNWVWSVRKKVQKDLDDLQQGYLSKIEKLKTQHLKHIEETSGQHKDKNSLLKCRYEQAYQNTEQIFLDYWNWIEETQQTEENRNPYVRVVAVFRG